MDCGGKRSATPLSSARGAIKHSKASPRTKAVSRLRPACGTTALQMLCKIRGPSPTRQRLGLRQSPAAFHPRAQTKLYSATIACKRPGGASRCPSGRTASRLNPNFTFLQKTTACLRLVNRKSHIVNSSMRIRRHRRRRHHLLHQRRQQRRHRQAHADE
jgi:hypothetical protein